MPSPVQRGHAPCGELNEKIRGASSGSEMPSSGQANVSEYVWVAPSTSLISTRPSASRSAVSIESVSRVRSPGFMASRSTTTEIVWRICLSRSIGVLEHALLAVDLDPGVAVGPQALEQILELALAAAHHRRVDGEPRALGQRQHLLDDLLGRLAGDLAAALGAVRMADAGVQQPQVVVGLGDRADGRSRVSGGGLLIDRDRRRQPVDRVDVGLVHLPEELAGIRRQRLHVAALTLGIQRVEGKRRLARPRQPGDHDQAVARERHRDVLEIVLPGAPDDDLFLTHEVTLAGDRQSNKCSPAGSAAEAGTRVGAASRLASGGAHRDVLVEAHDQAEQQIGIGQPAQTEQRHPPPDAVTSSPP